MYSGLCPLSLGCLSWEYLTSILEGIRVSCGKFSLSSIRQCHLVPCDDLLLQLQCDKTHLLFECQALSAQGRAWVISSSLPQAYETSTIIPIYRWEN